MTKLLKIVYAKLSHYFSRDAAENPYIVLNLISIAGAAIYWFYAFIFYFYTNSPLVVAHQIIFGFLYLFSIYINSKHIRYVSSFFLTIVICISCIFWTLTLGIKSLMPLYIFTVILPHHIFSDVTIRQKWFLTLLSCIFLNLSLYLGFTTVPLVPYENQWLFPVLTANLVISTIILELYIATFARQVTQRLAEASYQKDLQTAQIDSLKDPLTGLWNRRYFDLYEFSDNHPASGTANCIVMLDLDFFKQVNDTYGHLVGDGVLQHFAQLMQQSFRKTDVLIRWGGEEFLVLMRNIALDQAVNMVDRFRMKTLATPLVQDDQAISIYFTFTAGISEITPEKDLHTSINEADAFLYYGKQHGRNQVVSKRSTLQKDEDPNQ